MSGLGQKRAFLRGHAQGVRDCITWLHARAKTMNDPHAVSVLNGAAFNLGVEKPQTDLIAADARAEGQPLPLEEWRGKVARLVRCAMSDATVLITARQAYGVALDPDEIAGDLDKCTAEYADQIVALAKADQVLGNMGSLRPQEGFADPPTPVEPKDQDSLRPIDITAKHLMRDLAAMPIDHILEMPRCNSCGTLAPDRFGPSCSRPDCPHRLPPPQDPAASKGAKP